MQFIHEARLTSKTPGLIKETPGEDGRMIKVALDRLAHHRFKPLPSQRRISALAKIGKIAH